MADNAPPLRTDGLRWIHRLILWRYGISPQAVLNPGPAPTDGGPADSLAAELREISNAMKASAFDLSGAGVDYGRLRQSPIYREYRDCARRLRTFDPGMLSSRGERLAFWINLYNSLIVDAVIQFEVERSVAEVPGFFWRVAYGLGGRRYCAFDVEYGILRANAPHPLIPGPHFGSGDPRRRFSLSRLDPRVHFALVCAAQSCPPIGVYDPDRVDDQLALATRSFIHGGGVELDRRGNRARLSKIFQWYAPDFGAPPLALFNRRPLLQFIARYLDDESDREFVLHGRPAVVFQPYDWRLNYVSP